MLLLVVVAFHYCFTCFSMGQWHPQQVHDQPVIVIYRYKKSYKSSVTCLYVIMHFVAHAYMLWSSLHYHGFWANKLPCNYIDENNPWAMGNRPWCYSNKKVSALNSNAYMYVSICKQEAYGPNRSPEKPLHLLKAMSWFGEEKTNYLLFVIK